MQKWIKGFMSGSMELAPEDIRRRLSDAIEQCIFGKTAILFSGGLDTSIIAYEASRRGVKAVFTAALKNAEAPDIKYSGLMARKLGLDQRICEFSIEEAYKLLPEVISILKVFDPMEVRNSLPLYICLRQAKEEGIETVLTGDGADELFAGYDFIYNKSLEEIERDLRHLWGVMTFSSFELGKSVGIKVKAPYLTEGVKDLAMSAGAALKVGEKDGKRFGKYLLRKAYEGLLPDEIVWRAKTPIESGSGTSSLPVFFSKNIDDETFAKKRAYYAKEDGVRIRSKEQLCYYEMFREIVGVPKGSKGGRSCPDCNSSLREGSRFCRVCGAYPV